MHASASNSGTWNMSELSHAGRPPLALAGAPAGTAAPLCSCTEPCAMAASLRALARQLRACGPHSSAIARLRRGRVLQADVDRGRRAAGAGAAAGRVGGDVRVRSTRCGPCGWLACSLRALRRRRGSCPRCLWLADSGGRPPRLPCANFGAAAAATHHAAPRWIAAAGRSQRRLRRIARARRLASRATGCNAAIRTAPPRALPG